MKFYRKHYLPSDAPFAYVGVPTGGWGNTATPNVGFREVDVPQEAILAVKLIAALRNRERTRGELDNLDRVRELGADGLAAQFDEAEGIFAVAALALEAEVLGGTPPPAIEAGLLQSLAKYLDTQKDSDHEARSLLGRLRAHGD